MAHLTSARAGAAPSPRAASRNAPCQGKRAAKRAAHADQAREPGPQAGATAVPLEMLSTLSALLAFAGETRLAREPITRLATELARALAVPVLTIRLLDPHERWLDLKAAVGMPKSLRERVGRVPVDSPFGRALGRMHVLVRGSKGAKQTPFSLWPRAVSQRFGAGAFVPIRDGSTILGVLGVAYREAAPPPRSQLEFLEALGRQLGAALQAVRARQARRKEDIEALTLRKITAALSGNLEPRTVLDMVTAAAAKLTRASGAIVLLQGRDRSEFEVASQSDAKGRADLVGLRFPAEGSLANRVVQSGRPFRCRDARADPHAMIRDLVDLANVRGLLMVPVLMAGGRIGAIAVSTAKPRLFSNRDRRILTRLGQQASIAIQNARLFDAVRQHRQLLRQLYSQQFSILEDERKRIAHELHDELGPTLSATLINLQLVRALGAENPSLAAKVADTERLLKGTIEKVRSLAYGLRPPMLEHLGLAESLQWMIETYFNSGKPVVQYRRSGGGIALEPELALAIYRIAQEALTNVVKHARASRATVRLDISATELTLRISDDGVGFDMRRQPSERRVGLGLASMRERMEHLQGRMDIQSAPGRGTTLSVSCPVEEPRARALG